MKSKPKGARGDSALLLITDHSGRERRLPVDPRRLEGLRLAGARNDDGSLNNKELAALEPETYVLVVCQLYASQRGLPQPPTNPEGKYGGRGLAEWFERVVEHVETAPVGDPWADFISQAINETAPPPETL